MTRKQKLELTWIGKENRLKLEPRILREDPAKSYYTKFRHSPRLYGPCGNQEMTKNEKQHDRTHYELSFS